MSSWAERDSCSSRIRTISRRSAMLSISLELGYRGPTKSSGLYTTLLLIAGRNLARHAHLRYVSDTGVRGARYLFCYMCRQNRFHATVKIFPVCHNSWEDRKNKRKAHLRNFQHQLVKLDGQ